MKSETHIVTLAGDWFDPASKQIGLRKPTDLFIGFGERRFLPLATTPFRGVQYNCAVVSSSGGSIHSSSQIVQEYRRLLGTAEPESSRGYSQYIVPFQVRTTDIESDRAVLDCIAEINKTTALHRDTTPTYRGVVDFYPCTEPGFEMYGLTAEHYGMSRLVTLCCMLADIEAVAAFLPRYPDVLLDQRESERKFLDEIVAPLIEMVPALRIVLHQIRTTYGVEWVVKNAHNRSVDGKPRIIASLSPFDMQVPFDVERADLTEYQRWLCHDAVAVRYHAFAYPDLFCLGSGGVAEGVRPNRKKVTHSFRTPVVMQTLLECAFDVFRLPRLPSLSSCVSQRDRKVRQQVCASRIAELVQFAATTGPRYLGVPVPESSNRVVFEVCDCCEQDRWPVHTDEPDSDRNSVASRRADKALTWKCANLDSDES